MTANATRIQDISGKKVFAISTRGVFATLAGGMIVSLMAGIATTHNRQPSRSICIANVMSDSNIRRYKLENGIVTIRGATQSKVEINLNDTIGTVTGTADMLSDMDSEKYYSLSGRLRRTCPTPVPGVR